VVETARARLEILEEAVPNQGQGGRQIITGDMVVPNDAIQRPPPAKLRKAWDDPPTQGP
jgi:hypothetical protein